MLSKAIQKESLENSEKDLSLNLSEVYSKIIESIRRIHESMKEVAEVKTDISTQHSPELHFGISIPLKIEVCDGPESYYVAGNLLNSSVEQNCIPSSMAFAEPLPEPQLESSLKTLDEKQCF